MKAIIMAGGEGSRLRPLTCDCPKPMLPLLGRPLMACAVDLLKRHAISDIAVTLGYLPDPIMDHFGNGASSGVRLHYYIEKMPLGTAGSVAQARAFLNETFIVLSGDGVTDIDLSAALRFHRQKRALATLVLKKSAHPREYGMVVCAPDGRILSFHEKPGRGDVYSDLINTGIYILEPELLAWIPEGQACDFGHDLFPLLLKNSLPVYGYVADGYWCDVGDVSAYLRVHADALDGRIRLNLPAPSPSAAYPVYISPDAHVAPNAQIDPYSVIGSGCRVSSGASVKRSILLSGAQVESGARLRGCVVGVDSVVQENAQLFEESVVGARSIVGQRAILPSGVKLWPEKQLPEGERPDENVVWGACRQQRFVGGALMLESPAQAARAVQACVAQLQPQNILLAHSGSTVAAAMWHAAAAGVLAQGVQIIDAAACSLPQLRYCLSLLRLDAALFMLPDCVLLLNGNGAIMDEKQQRSILRCMERQDFPRPFRSVTPPILPANCGSLAFIANLAQTFRSDPQLAPSVVLCAEGHAAETAHALFRRIGLKLRCVCAAEELRPDEDEIGVLLSETGEQAVFSDAQSTFSDVEVQLARAWTAIAMGEDRLILPVNATRAIDRLGANALYLSSERAAWMNTLAQNSPLQFRLHFDGLYFALCFLSLLTEKGLSLRQWRATLPSACCSHKQVFIPEKESGRILHALAKNNAGAELGGGIRLPRRDGWAWLGPDDTGARLNIIAEAQDMETAAALCDFYDGEIRRLLAPAAASVPIP